GRGGVRASDGADGFLVALSAEGETRWTSVVGEQGDDEVVALATREGAVHAAANVHRERIGARCGGQVVVLRNREWAKVEEEECLAAGAAAFDDASRLWVLENAGRALRARAFSPTDGPRSVRGAGAASEPRCVAWESLVFRVGLPPPRSPTASWSRAGSPSGTRGSRRRSWSGCATWRRNRALAEP